MLFNYFWWFCLAYTYTCHFSSRINERPDLRSLGVQSAKFVPVKLPPLKNHTMTNIPLWPTGLLPVVLWQIVIWRIDLSRLFAQRDLPFVPNPNSNKWVFSLPFPMAPFVFTGSLPRNSRTQLRSRSTMVYQKEGTQKMSSFVIRSLKFNIRQYDRHVFKPAEKLGCGPFVERQFPIGQVIAALFVTKGNSSYIYRAVRQWDNSPKNRR